MASVDHLRQRKGAFRIALIPPEVLEALNDGLLETVNLNEFMALELPRLARSVAGHIGLDAANERLGDTFAMLPAFKPMQRHGHIARALYDLTAEHPERDAVAHRLATHPSDVARGWATQWIQMSALPLLDQLDATRRFAADSHFGVREMAWMAVRDAPSVRSTRRSICFGRGCTITTRISAALRASSRARVVSGARRSSNSKPSPGWASPCWSRCGPIPAGTSRTRLRTGSTMQAERSPLGSRRLARAGVRKVMFRRRTTSSAALFERCRSRKQARLAG